MQIRTVKHLLVSLLLLMGIHAQSQIYPVVSQFRLTPPYPLSLVTYSQEGFQNMHLDLVLNDNTKVNYRVGLRLVIEGQMGVRMETPLSAVNQHVVLINPGLNTISIDDLHDLFKLENLVSTGLELADGAALPEGMYSFRVEVYDLDRIVLASNPFIGAHMSWISRFEPPLLTFPADDAVIAIPETGANIPALFLWVPRGVYPGVTDIAYTLELIEILDENIAPEELFSGGNGDPLTFSVQTTLTSHNLLFPTDFAGMQPNRWYAWRVRAEDRLSKVFYRNDGYSQVKRFYYGQPCDIPENFLATESEENAVQLTWDGEATETFSLEVRNATMGTGWKPVDAIPAPDMIFTGLRSGMSYQFRLSRMCEGLSSEFAILDYTNPGILDIDCLPPQEFSARVDTSWLWGQRLAVDWEHVPGALDYRVDARSDSRTLSKQTSVSAHNFRWGARGLSGDTIWLRMASRCWQDSGFVYGEEQQVVMRGGAGGSGCTAPALAIDSAITYATGITQVYWPADNYFQSYTLLWRPAGMSAPYQQVSTARPPALIQGIQDGDSVECRIVYHCQLGADTSNVAGFRTRRFTGIISDPTGVCYEPSYPQAFVPSYTSAHLLWEPEPAVTGYEVNWKKEGEFIWNISQVEEEELLLEGLEANATYVYRIRSACSGGTRFSRWTAEGKVSLSSLSSPSDSCGVPAYEQIDVNSATQASITFVDGLDYTTYGGEYRIRNEIEWTEGTTRGSSVQFNDLSPETTYEVKVRGFCGTGRSAYSAIDTFTTRAPVVEEVLQCGSDDGETPGTTNTTPIFELSPGTRILANGWKLYISQVNQSGDVYNGTAYAQVPYLKGAMVEFALEDAKVNSDSVMYGGRAVMRGVNVQLIDPELVERIEYLVNIASLGPDQAQVALEELTAIVDVIPNLGGGIFGTDTTGFSVKPANELFELGLADLTSAKDTLLVGLKNVIVARDLAQSGVNILGLAVKKMLLNSLQGKQLAPLDSCVVFLPAAEGDLDFDYFRYTGSESQYTVRRTVDEQKYYVPVKAIVPGMPGEVRVVLPDSEVSEDLVFKSKAGVEVPYTQSGTTTDNGKAVLNLLLNSALETVLAYDSIYYPGSGDARDTTLFSCVGELAVKNYPVKIKNVVLVPVNGANKLASGRISTIMQELTARLNELYAPSNVNWTVTQHSGVLVNDVVDGIDDNDNNILTKFPADMNVVIDAFEAEVNPANDTWYFFLVDRSDKTTKDGYMPFQQRYGFLTVGDDESKENFIRTAAHELGHGAFNLRHPFSNRVRNPLPEGSTDNLMDYNNGEHLFAYQWELVDDPKFTLTWFMSEDEAAQSTAFDDYLKNKLNELSENSDHKVLGFAFCEKCREKEALEIKIKANQSLSVSGNGLLCQVYYQDFAGSSELGTQLEINLEEWADVDAGAVLDFLSTFKGEKSFFAFLNKALLNVNSPYLGCIEYLDAELKALSICDGDEIDQAIFDRLYASLITCLEDNILFMSSELEAQISDRLNNELGDGATFRLSLDGLGNKSTYDKEGLSESDDADFHLSYKKDAEGNWQTTISIRNGYLTDLGYNQEEANEILGYLLDVIQRAQVSFCDQPGPNCSDKILNSLQVMHVNLKHISNEGTMHPSMWDDNSSAENIYGLLEGYHMSPIIVGGVDAVTDEVMSIPLLVKTAMEVILIEETRQAFSQIFTSEGATKLVDAVLEDVSVTLGEQDKTEYFVSKASVELVLAYYVLLGKAVKGVSNYLSKVKDVAEKLDGSPNLAKYLRKVVVDNAEKTKAQRIEKLLGHTSASDVEKLIGLVPEEKLDDFIADISESSTLAAKLAEKPDLVDAWKVLDDAGIDDAIRKNPVRLGEVDNYLKKNPGTEDAIKQGISDVGEYQDEFMNGIKNATEDLSHLNGRSALPDEIADAVTRIKQHRIDVNKPSSGNFGHLDGDINGSAVDNKMWSSGPADPNIEPQIFDATEVGGWVRNTDSEFKMLNKLADDLGGVKGQSYPDVNGTLKIVSERPYCASCQGVIQQFNEMFPNIELILVDGVR